MDPCNLQTPEETLARWHGTECKCDPDAGFLCECCHDIQVLNDLIQERDRLLAGIRDWSYCTSQGMRRECPEKVEELAEFLISCKIAPWYIRTKTLETVKVYRD